MKTHYAIAIIGGGQAGLSLSYCLKEKGLTDQICNSLKDKDNFILFIEKNNINHFL